MEEQDTEERSGEPREFIHVLFECCGVYQRIYKRRNQAAYIGWCPKCGRRVCVKIGPGGTPCRFFRAK